MTIIDSGMDIDVFRRYAGLSLPRHVSYPMPTWWQDIGGEKARSMVSDPGVRSDETDYSLYLHLPFCETLCKFCACNRVIQRKSSDGAVERTDRYVRALQCDIRRLARDTGAARPVRQIHFGGGSPLYLSPEQFARVHETIGECFDVAPNAEVAVEVDPRNATRMRLKELRRLGFNRVSMGVQDFDEQVQSHVRRIQPFEQVREVVENCREEGLESINFDLIYGLPYQTVETNRKTLELTLELSPDRIAYYHYAQIPQRIATQRGIDHTKLPDSETKLQMFLAGHDAFTRSGYRFIGLDHFSKADDALNAAKGNGTLQRNFQGMTTGGGLHLLAAGVSAISHLRGIGFLQNVKDTDGYVARIEANEAPVNRGLAFSSDDLIRQAVLNQLYCQARIVPDTIESQFDIVFADYFERELTIMQELQRDGLVAIHPTGEIEATFPLGRVLMRNVAAVFDAYLDPEAYRVGEKVCFSMNA